MWRPASIISMVAASFAPEGAKMPVTYTNRKGRVYFLCEGRTRTGKPRYNFSTEQKETPVETIPTGYEIQESVNGIVSLVRIKPCLLTPEEINSVDSALKARPEASRYRLSTKSNVITIHELIGPSRKELRFLAERIGIGSRSGIIAELEAINEQFRPILRFTLTDTIERLFMAERWCFRGSIDGWICVQNENSIKYLATKLIPVLGTDAFYEL